MCKTLTKIERLSLHMLPCRSGFILRQLLMRCDNLMPALCRAARGLPQKLPHLQQRTKIDLSSIGIRLEP